VNNESTGRQEDVRDYAFNACNHVRNLAESHDATDHPVVRRALRMIKAFPTQKDVIDSNVKDVERVLKPRIKVNEIYPNPFDPNPTGAEADGEIRLGTVDRTGIPFGLNLNELAEHTLITGRAGAGKTTLIYIILSRLIELGIPFWAFDFKQDYRHLAKTGKVLVFDYSTFTFNPLRPPAGVEPHLWMQAFSNVFCQVYWLLSGSKAIILEHVNRLYTDYGVFSGKDVYPTFHDLLESLRGHKPTRTYGREAGFVESAQNRASECLLSLGKMLSCDKGFSIEDLLTRNIVFELEGMLAENQAFLLNIILRYVFLYRISNSQRGRLQHVFLFDEAKSVYSRQREFSEDLGTSEIAQFTASIREFGEALVVADQIPTELGKSIKDNVRTVICMSQSGGRNVAEMSRAIGLTVDQEERLRILKADKNNNLFEAIVNVSGKWARPFVIRVSPFQYEKDVTRQQLQTLMKPVLEDLTKQVVPRTEYKSIQEARQKQAKEAEAEERRERQEKAEEKEKVEGNTLIRILTNIRDYPFIPQKARIEMLGLEGSSSTTDKYFDELFAQGLVTKHSIGFGKGKGSITLYKITEKGASFARMDNVDIPGHGEMPHKYWQHVIKEFYARLGYSAEIEKRFGIKNADVGFENDGKKTAIEVELTNEHLIENIERDFQAGCDTVIIAAPSKRSITAYRKRIELYSKAFLDKVEFRVLTDFLR
jgi:hypothetical protein